MVSIAATVSVGLSGRVVLRLGAVTAVLAVASPAKWDRAKSDAVATARSSSAMPSWEGFIP